MLPRFCGQIGNVGYRVSLQSDQTRFEEHLAGAYAVLGSLEFK